MLRSPVYAGVLRFGHRPVGKFAQCAEETILVADAHPEIVGLPLFEQVQSALDSAYRGRGKSEPGRYLLSGLLRCLHCGRRLVGAMTFGETHKAGFRRDYRCRTSSDGIKVCSVHPSSEANVLEEMVLRFVREKFLSEENRGPLLAAARRLEARQNAPSLDEQQLAELRRKIDRGTQNLALADGENFAAIAKLLDGWRDQERKLVAKLRSGPAEQAHLSPRVLEALANLAAMRDSLHQANRVHLAAALKESIVEIRVGREMRSQGRVTFNRVYGTLTFHPELWSEGPISFDDWDLRPDAHYLKVAKYVQAADRDVPLKELTAHMGLYYQTVRYHVHRAVLAGLIEPAERLGNGWRTVQTAAFCG